MLIMCEVVSNECHASPPPPTSHTHTAKPKRRKKGFGKDVGYSVPGRPSQNVQTVHRQAVS